MTFGLKDGCSWMDDLSGNCIGGVGVGVGRRFDRKEFKEACEEANRTQLCWRNLVSEKWTVGQWLLGGKME